MLKPSLGNDRTKYFWNNSRSVGFEGFIEIFEHFRDQGTVSQETLKVTFVFKKRKKLHQHLKFSFTKEYFAHFEFTQFRHCLFKCFKKKMFRL